MSRIRSFVVSGEFQLVCFLGGLVGFFPFGGGGEFAGWGGLAFFQKSVGAEDDAVGIPEPDKPEATDGFELEKAVAEGVDLLFVLGESMFAGVIEELGEFGEFVGLEMGGGGGEEGFGRADGAVGEEVDTAGSTGLVEGGFHEDYLTCELILQENFRRLEVKKHESVGVVFSIFKRCPKELQEILGFQDRNQRHGAVVGGGAGTRWSDRERREQGSL